MGTMPKTSAYDGYTADYMKTVNEEFDRATDLIGKLSTADDAFEKFGEIIGMSNHRLHLATLQMGHEKHERRREEQHQRQIEFTKDEEEKPTAEIVETVRKNLVKRCEETLGTARAGGTLSEADLKKCNETIAQAEKTPVYGLGNPNPVFFVAGAVDVRVFFDEKPRGLVQAVRFDGVGEGELILVGHPGDDDVQALVRKQGNLSVVVWDENKKEPRQAFTGIVRTYSPVWGVSVDDIVIETRIKFSIIEED